MNVELVSVISSDKLYLPGLLFQPKSSTNKVIVWLHGMGDDGVFYNPKFVSALASALTKKGIAFLAFNNRGAHHKKSLRLEDETLPEEDRVYLGGTHYEAIKDCVYDIDGAVQFLGDRGYSEFFLMGHSTGANKICAYHTNSKNNPFRRYVLTGPGDDSGLFYHELGERKFWSAIDYAKTAIERGTPFKLMPEYTGMHPFSAKAALDILDPNGNYNTFPFFEATSKRLGTKPLFKEYQSIRVPLMVVVGENDEYTYTAGGSGQALELLKKHTHKSVATKSSFRIIPDSDHSFHGQEIALAEAIATWLVVT